MKSYYRWIILAVACLALFSPNYSQYQLSPLAPQLMESFQLSMSQFSSIFAAPMLSAIFLGLISGLLVDKYGIKMVIGIGLIATAIGTCLRVFATDYMTMYIYMIMVGLGATFLNSNAAKVIGSYFPPEKISSMMSILLASATLAMTVGMGTTGLFPSMTSAFIFAAIISVAGAVSWFIFMKNPQKNSSGEAQTPPSISIGESLKVVVKSKTIWVVGFCLSGILACNVAMSSFLPTALIGRGIDSVAAGMYASIMTLGSLAGCLSAPIMASKVGKMKPVLFVLAVIAAIGAAMAWNMTEGFLLGASLFIAGASISGMMPLLMSIPIQLPEIGPLYAGTAGGFTSTLQLLGAVLIPTYVITPIAGTNMNTFFILAGGCMAFVAVFVILLPEIMKKVVLEKSSALN